MKTFRITSEKGYYFLCKVFNTKREMYAYYKKRCKRWGEEIDLSEWAARISPYEKRNGDELSKDIGEALFWRGKLGFGLTSHEMLHCSLWHERLVEGNTTATFGEHCGEIEERLAYTLTEYGRQFNEKCIKYNLYQ